MASKQTRAKRKIQYFLISDCSELSFPTGVREVTHEVKYGTAVIIKCVTGYSKLSNTTSFSCQANGHWSANLTGHCYKGKLNKHF